jgi:uncharacterized membrane protein YeaQ/YmgE (transglycosylase-associated protein family)
VNKTGLSPENYLSPKESLLPARPRWLPALHLNKKEDRTMLPERVIRACKGGMYMIGMSFASFVTLLILGFIAAIVIHSLIRYRMLEGIDGFLMMWVAGWVGGWLGSPVLGHWWFQIQNIYVIPALVGAFVGAFSAVAMVKASARAAAGAVPSKTPATAVVPEMLKKAS